MTAAPEPCAHGMQRTSALRRSALQRLTLAAIPIAFLWLAVGFALDVFA
ncbi:MAG: hypothetical protein V7704_11205 [Aurantimonas endophytica]|uniref:Uncharacterized protein n=1 Tax=Aurantimonas endophytica TaxID=1522175 RepID=A0A7W6MNU2_9HYPH|nr:hypothetical protein [Aurantimonas endophytica]MBB4002225.1 hypothetical protein [Aurantimonas endophytica]MCO6402149.1 hypothetical protein [Aurantimonas endophytica]